ncbi:MAG: hypothetical protein K2Y27_14820 [Xanthobacteraceae bacterium]|nr:hypothetical protein [Xanthobacteraceae bacterium]
MNKPPDYEAREFHVETKFQQLAKRPGGVSREQAVANAQASVATLKPGFETWLDDEIAMLLRSVPKDGQDLSDKHWMDAANSHCQHLADVSATMGYEFVSYVANNLCLMFDAIRHGADYRRDVMKCHVDALLLGRKDKFRRMKPEDVPELTDGLRRVLGSQKPKTATVPGSTAKS